MYSDSIHNNIGRTSITLFHWNSGFCWGVRSYVTRSTLSYWVNSLQKKKQGKKAKNIVSSHKYLTIQMWKAKKAKTHNRNSEKYNIINMGINSDNSIVKINC